MLHIAKSNSASQRPRQNIGPICRIGPPYWPRYHGHCGCLNSQENHQDVLTSHASQEVAFHEAARMRKVQVNHRTHLSRCHHRKQTLRPPGLCESSYLGGWRRGRAPCTGSWLQLVHVHIQQISTSWSFSLSKEGDNTAQNKATQEVLQGGAELDEEVLLNYTFSYFVMLMIVIQRNNLGQENNNRWCLLVHQAWI